MHRLQLTVVGFAAVISLLTTQFVLVADDLALLKSGGDIRQGDQPFTGVVVQVFSPLQIKKLAFYWQGKKNWNEYFWHSNGQLAEVRSYTNGTPIGKHRGWHPDGRVKYYKEYVNGQPVGEGWSWHGNGQVATYIRYSQGEEVAFKSWTNDGKPFYNHVWDQGRKVGYEGGGFCKPRKI